ncbi:hypothetical protein RRG08_059916 [Elysia crispata]|uniref:Uncharacterized protein n=1 Tax=Elysia crispata TaxID=231223 RepID=A0AAE0Y896_9GAST|nr:hypothetical protein RRG08_059916 [Elysia crispata]
MPCRGCGEKMKASRGQPLETNTIFSRCEERDTHTWVWPIATILDKLQLICVTLSIGALRDNVQYFSVRKPLQFSRKELVREERLGFSETFALLSRRSLPRS